MLVSCSGCSRGISGFASRMDTQLPEQREEDVQALLQDVLAFIDTCEDAAPSVRRGGPLKGIGDCAPKRRSTGRYSPDYERSRREKKKKEREGLRAQVAQYEAQLELLKLQTARPSREAKWGWVDEATEEELKRRSAEELNRQLRGILVQQVNAVKKLGGLLDQEAAFAKRVQVALAGSAPCAAPTPTGTFSGLGAIAAHLKDVFSRLRDSSSYVFGASPLFSEEMASAGALMCCSNVKLQDPIAGPCIEIVSSMPLARGFDSTVSLLWEMLVGKEAFGPREGTFVLKTKHLTEDAAEFGYSLKKDFGVRDMPEALDGVTLMEKRQEEGCATLLWTSMMVEHDGKPHFRSQGWISVTRLPSNPREETFIRSCSRISGRHFGAPFDVGTARNHLVVARSRMERVQQRIQDRAERRDD